MTRWKVWQLAPDSDPRQRWIVTTADGDEEICAVVEKHEHAVILAAAPELLEFAKMVANLKLATEFGEDQPPTEDWQETLEELIASARKILKAVK